jgi:hypothetical protein
MAFPVQLAFRVAAVDSLATTAAPFNLTQGGPGRPRYDPATAHDDLDCFSAESNDPPPFG